MEDLFKMLGTILYFMLTWWVRNAPKLENKYYRVTFYSTLVIV